MAWKCRLFVPLPLPPPHTRHEMHTICRVSHLPQLQAGEVEIAKALLSAGADIRARDNEQSTPLMYAASNVSPGVPCMWQCCNQWQALGMIYFRTFVNSALAADILGLHRRRRPCVMAFALRRVAMK